MKIENYRINWNFKVANDPELILFVNEFADESEFIYQKDGPLYFAEHANGEVRFFYYDGPGSGFGGHDFEITVTDGDMLAKEVLRGPYASRPGVFMQAGFTDCNEVVFVSGMASYHGYMTIDSLNKMLVASPDIYGESCYLGKVRNPRSGEFKFVPISTSSDCDCVFWPEKAKLAGNFRCANCGHHVYIRDNPNYLEMRMK
jgi:hypothetical protein